MHRRTWGAWLTSTVVVLLMTIAFVQEPALYYCPMHPDVTSGDMAVTLTLPDGGLVAGREETLRYQLEDARTGAPLTDLEPYLGAFGHALVMSADTMHYVHAHPVELLPHVGADEVPPGGPALTFKALLPKPGAYRIWTQIKRRGQVSTVPFTVTADSPTRR